MNNTIESEGKKQWRKDVEEVLGILARQLPEELHTNATRRFCEKHSAPSVPSSPQSSVFPQQEDKLLKLETQNAQLVEEAQKSRQERDATQSKNIELEEKLHQKEAQLESKSIALAQLEQEFAKFKAENIQDPEPAQLEQELAKLSPPLRDIAGKYFDLEHIHIFLIQCGQFSRITQCWEACVRWILAENPIPKDMADFLLRLSELYNKGSAQAEAKTLIIEVGIAYDYEKHQRVGQDGSMVRQALLPGLENAAGKIVHKPLVVLS